MAGERALRVGDGWFDPVGGDLLLDGRTCKLRPRTAALFAYLICHCDRIVGKDELMQAVWPDVVVTEDSLVQCVKEIRRALGERGHEWVRTVPRQGYAFAGVSGSPHEVPAPPARTGLPWRAAVAVLAVLAAAWLAVFSFRTVGGTKAQAPSIAVMPLANRTQGAVHDDVVDELTERLIDSLSRMPGTTVIAAGTAFSFKGHQISARKVGAELGVRYVLEGSLRRQPASMTLDVRLVDASNAVQLWGEEFTAEPGQTATLRDEVLARVANSLGLRLVRAEAVRSQREHPQDPAATDLVTRALAALRWSGQGQEGIRLARQLLEQAVQRDPQLAEAWGLLAMTYLDQIRFSNARQQMLQRASDAAERALALAPETALSHEAKAKVLYNQGRLMDQALAEFDRAIELRPNDPMLHANRGATLAMLGRPGQGLAAIERAMLLSPRDPKLPTWQMLKGATLLHLGREVDAIQVLERSVQANPSDAFGHLFLASAYGLAGSAAAGAGQVALLRQLAPDFTIGRMREREPSDEPAFRAQRERIYDGLRRAGLPD